MKQIRRIIKVPCDACLGTGHGIGRPCETCRGTGEVDRPVVEIIHDDNAPVGK
jgi:DnaJ-class molecular chaperone